VATIIERIFGNRAPEQRTESITIPVRSNTVASPEAALTLTPVSRSIQIISNPVAKLDLVTYRYQNGQETRIENSLFANRPCLTMTRRDFFIENCVDLYLYGNAYWLKQFDNQGRIVQVIQLPANSVGVRFADNKINKIYDYAGKTYNDAEIEHLRLMPRAGALKGMSILELCRADIVAALDLRDYQANWFSASGVPTGVITSTRDLTKEDADLITANWHTKQMNRQVAVMSAGFGYQHTALSPRDALMTEVASQITQNIARLSGVPARALLTGVDGSSDTYANLQDEDAILLRYTLSMYSDTIANGMTNCLPRGTRVEFDFGKLFQADPKSRFEMYDIGLAGQPFMTVDEVRAKENLA